MAGRFPPAIPSFEGEWTPKRGRELSEILNRLARGMGGLQGGSGDPTTIEAGVDGDPGASQAVAAADHVHPVDTAVPSYYVVFGGAIGEGTGTGLMRADAQLVLSPGGTDGHGLFWSSGATAWTQRAPYIQFSAGLSSASVPNLVFSNSNGVSFGLSGSTVTASVLAGGNLNLSAGTTSNNLTNIVFSNSNRISFGLDGSTVTGSYNFNFSAGTTSNDLTNLVFSNSNGVSFGLSGSTVTASVVTGGNLNVSAGTTSNNLTNMVFANGNGVTFGLDGSTISASVNTVAGGGVLISSYQNVVGTFSVMTWNGASVSHAVAFQLPQNGSFEFLRMPALMTWASTSISTLASSANMSVQRAWTFNAVVYSMGTGASSKSLMSVASGSMGWTILNSASIATNGTQGSYTQAMTYHAEGNQFSISTQYSASSAAMPFSSAMFQSYSNGRLLDIHFNNSLSAGPYWLVVGYSSSSVTNSARISLARTVGAYYANHYGAAQGGPVFSALGVNGLVEAFLGGGSFSTAGGGTVPSLHMSQISSIGAQVHAMFQLLRSA